MMFHESSAIFENVYTINDFSGSHQSGFSGDGGPALLAQQKAIRGVWVNTDNEVYLSDFGNRRVRKVDNNDIITTIAGSGEATVDTLTENQAATTANFSPAGLFIDTNGILYIPGQIQHYIRKVDLDTSIITAVAGTGVVSSSQTGVNGDGGSPTSATLKSPLYTYVMTTGLIYISDSGDNRVRAISPSNIMYTFAGSCFLLEIICISTHFLHFLQATGLCPPLATKDMRVQRVCAASRVSGWTLRITCTLARVQATASEK